MRTAVQKKIHAFANKLNINKILLDIDIMQISENEHIFLLLYKLFRKKWEHEHLFLRYFEEEWFNKNRN